ncbi:hypothetical protein SAMN05518871_10121 [Psychrobacillus sp. OK028]|uniref:immunoglobulin-like domain-containing protein n=1 Tax=Psychrobacillus sp. OK028 TaxID=1884359 RepID=UPI0008854751|nr:immunoglobulin-like domain-containing protein [Psychrobacillus sp. OK028]SDM35519.1 hypothetical protein SAMN05518871_10121 [Psychrobacillus sp. OK028]
MKRLLAIGISILLLSSCNPAKESVEVETTNSIGTYQELYIPKFARVVNDGTSRNSTGNVFIRYGISRGGSAIEVYPGSTYEPDLPDKLQKGYVMKVVLEEVNRHAEKPLLIDKKTTSNLEEASVKIPDEPGKLYRYTLKVYDKDGNLKDTRYDPLYTTFETYNMALKIMKDQYKPNEQVTFIVENWGPNHLSYGTNWNLYKQEKDKWVEVKRQPQNDGFLGPALIHTAWSMTYLDIEDESTLLTPGSHNSELLTGYTLTKGTYKLALNAGSAKHKYVLEDTFIVK